MIDLNDKSFAATTSTGTILVDFWATWCGPCKVLAGALEKIEGELSDHGIQVGKVEIDANPDITKEYNISSVPTIIIFKDGIEVDRIIGAVPPNRLLELAKAV